MTRLSSSSRRPAGRRFSLVTVALLVTMVIAIAGAVALHRAVEEHRRSVVRGLEEFTDTVRRMLVMTASFHSKGLSLHSFAPAIGPAAEPLPLERFARHASYFLDMDLGPDSLRGYFRVDLATGAFQGRNAAARPGADTTLLRMVREGPMDPTWPQGPVAAFGKMGGTRVAVFFYREVRTKADGTHEPLAVLGYMASEAAWMKALAEATLKMFPLIPPAHIVPAEDAPVSPSPMGPRVQVRMDTLVAVEIRGEHGDVIYQSPARYVSPIRRQGRGTLGGAAIVATLTLNPVVVERVMRDHRHPEWTWVVVGLPVLSLLLGLSAIANLRRERELLRTREEFVAGVSHELRTPLAQIRMFAETLLLGRERSPEERRRWLGVIRREALRLGDLVENVLLFTHLERAGLRVAPEDADLARLAREVAESYEPLAAARGARIEAHAPPRLPVRADPRALRQVLVNLLDNALKYGPEGQTISLSLSAGADGRARLSVADQGAGIAPADRERVWAPFVRLTHAGGTAGGSGIGLAVVRSLVRQHGGDVLLDDAPGGGARFTVVLPLDGAAALPAETDAAAD